MLKLLYKDQIMTVNELSEISGIAPATIRDRLRRGFSVEEAVRESAVNDSVREFADASWWEDWIGHSTDYVYEIYFEWCFGNGYEPLQKQGFTRHIMSMYPNLKTVPSRRNGGCCRVVRER